MIMPGGGAMNPIRGLDFPLSRRAGAYTSVDSTLFMSSFKRQASNRRGNSLAALERRR